MPDRRQTQNLDHDLLIRVDENLRNLILEFKDLKDGTKKQIEAMEARITSLERWQWRIAGAVTIIAFVAPFLLSLIERKK